MHRRSPTGEPAIRRRGRLAVAVRVGAGPAGRGGKRAVSLDIVLTFAILGIATVLFVTGLIDWCHPSHCSTATTASR